METQNKYLLLARRAREEDNAEDAKKYYDMVRTEDPDNAEAKFFYSYYHMYSGKVGEAVHNYLTLCKGIDSTLKMIIASECADEEKKALIKSMLNCIITAYGSAKSAYYKVNTGSIVEIKEAYYKSMENIAKMYIDNFGADDGVIETYYTIQSEQYSHPDSLFRYANEIECQYSASPKLMALAVKFWKGCVNNKENGEAAIAKIQKYDPTYVAPTPKEGFADKLIKKITTLIGKK